ncbi:hypothetical protein ACWD4J_43690, partial [Streptomyces sp. NPDC002577]
QWVAVDGMLPHEAAYWSKVFTAPEDGGFTGLDAHGISRVEESRNEFERLVDKPLPAEPWQDEWLESWLRLHGMTARQVLERLTPAHSAALATYTTSTYQLINPLLKSDPDEARSALRSKIEWLVEEHLRDETPLPHALWRRPEFGALAAMPSGGEDPEYLARQRERFQTVVEWLLPAIEREMAAHAAMLADALQQLPPATGEVWRGTRLVGYDGSELSFDRFASFSRDREEAVGGFLFESKAPRPDSHPVLIHAELTGNWGRDISPFSMLEDEEEVLLLPSARLIITSREVREDEDRRVYELIEAVEELPELPFTPLRNALQQIAGSGSLVKRDDLLPLAGWIGAADGLQVWHLGALASEVYGGSEHVTVERLSNVRRAADLARGVLRIGPDTQIAGTHLDALVRRLDGSGAITPVDDGARSRLVELVRRLATSGQQVTYPRLADAWRAAAGAQDQEDRAGESPGSGGDLSMLPGLKRFVTALGKLDERAAAELWREASRITAEHNPFRLTVGEGGGSLLERDSQRFWATMRVAQVLHEFSGEADRIDQGVAVAQELAARRGVSAVREGLLGGSTDVAVAESIGSRANATASRAAQMSEPASGKEPGLLPEGAVRHEAVQPDGTQVRTVLAPGVSVWPETTSAPSSGPGFAALYADPGYLPRAQEFERRLGEFASGHPSARTAARQSLERLLEVLTDAHPAERREDIAKVLLGGLEPADEVGGTTAVSRLQSFLERGGSRELMTAFANGVLFQDSALTLKALLRGIAGSGDWAEAERLGLDAEALREQRAVLEGAELPSGVLAGTAARLGNAFRLLNVPEADGEAFALAVIGRMLPLGDRSLYEVLAGLQTTDVVPSLVGNPLDDAALVYRSIPGVSLAEVRQQVGTAGMLPHEALYWSKIFTPVPDGGFTGLGPRGRSTTRERLADFKDLVDQPLPDAPEQDSWTERWLRVNGMTARQVLERLTPAHFAALVTYTALTYELINPLLKPDANEARSVLRKQIEWHIEKHLSSGLTLLPVLGKYPEFAALTAVSRRGMEPEQLERHRERFHAVVERLLPAIEREMAAHAAMLADALQQLPPVSGEVWRGTRLVGYEGSELSFGMFASHSRDREEAERFLFVRNDPLPGSHRVLVRAELTGNAGRDISAFSATKDEQEVLLLPWARLNITSREVVGDGERAYELVEAVEELPELPPSALRNALQQIAGSGSLVRHDDLLPLAHRIGAADGLQVWHVGELASEVYGGPEHVTVERLANARRAADLARDVLSIAPDTQITGTHLDALVRRLDGTGAITPVDEGARSRLVDLAGRLDRPGQQVTHPRLAAVWRTAAAADDQESRSGQGSDSGDGLHVLLHGNEGAPDRYERAVAVAKALAAESGVDAARRPGLLGGSADVAVAESSGSRTVQPDATQEPTVPASGVSVWPESTSAPSRGPGLGALYADPGYLPRAQEFERRLGEFASGHPSARTAARQSLERLLEVLTDAHPAERREDIAKVLLGGLEPADEVGGTTAESRLQSFLERGGSRELMTAFANGVLFQDSALTLKALLRGIAGSGDWAEAERLGLDAEALREQRAVLEGAELPSGVLAGTAARLGNAFRLLNVPEADGEAFALAVIGRMLPLGDRSLYEVLAGLQTTDVVPSLVGNPLDDAALVYRSIPGVSLAEVRQQVGTAGMLPHEALYWSKITTGVHEGGFSEPSRAQLGTVDRKRKKFENLVGVPLSDTPPLYPYEESPTQRWLRENRTTASQVLEKVSPAHVAALVAYTGTAFALMDTVLTSGPAEVRPALRSRIKLLIEEHLRDHWKLSPALTDGQGVRGLLARLARRPEEKARLTEELHAAVERLLPAIEQEMVVHTAMLMDALGQLPPASGVVWRGVGSVAGIGGIDSSDLSGSEMSFPAFASFSRSEDQARGFMNTDQVRGVRPVLVRAELAGNMGRDISAFSVHGYEREVLLLPGARVEIVSHKVDSSYIRAYKLIEAREAAPPSAELQRFAVTFGKLDERAAGELWGEAARITAEHNPFRLTVDEGGGSLLERDPEQFWATMRVAQVLHEFTGEADRTDRAVAVAQELAAQWGVSAVREGLLGGAPDLLAGESSGAGATRESDVPVTVAAPAPVSEAVPGGSAVFAEGPGLLSVLYTDPAYVPMALDFEERLADYAAGHPRAGEMAQRTVARLFYVLSEAHPDLSEEEITAVFLAADEMPVDQAEEEARLTSLDDLMELDVRELMAAFSQAALSSDSPLALPALLRGIAGSGDWASAEELGLDVRALRESATAVPLPERASQNAAELGNVLRTLNLSEADGEGFALALIGWLLPQQEHSLYEVLAGLRTADVVPSLAGTALEDAARMYRSIPGLELNEVREQVTEHGLLPHEAVYWSKIQDGVFAEPGPAMVQKAAERRVEFASLAGELSDLELSEVEVEPSAERWLLLHDMAPEVVLERLALPHFVALMAYTGTASPLMNTVLKFGPAEVRSALRSRIRRIIDERFGKPLTDITPVLTSDPVARQLFAADRRDLTPEEKAHNTEILYVVAERLLPAIEREMAAHSAMLLDALEQLPPATGEVWRGKRSAEELFAGTGYGDPADSGRSEFSFPAFASFSRDDDSARHFMRLTPLPTAHPVLVQAELTGHWGRDITAFSAKPEEEEVLLLPGARLKIESRSFADDGEGEYEHIEAREVAPPSAALQWFAEAFGKLDERTGGELWREAARITAEHNPFDLTVAEGGGSLLERDSEQYWAIMRVAQELHQNAGAPDRDVRAVTVARALAEERGVGVSRPGLRGGAAETTAQARPPRTAPEVAPTQSVSEPSDISGYGAHEPSPALADGVAVPSGASRAPQEMVQPVADPVLPEQWEHRRAEAQGAQLVTERFDPMRGKPLADGWLPGNKTRIRATVRRVQAEDLRWVRDVTLHLPVRFGEGFTAQRLPEFEGRWRAALDGYFNTGLRLPRSGDQLHIGLQLTPVSDDREAIELSMSSEPEMSHQLQFQLESEDPALDPAELQARRQRNDLLGLHELAHYVGLQDAYFDPDSVFRNTPEKSADTGIMASVTTARGTGVPRRYLEIIEGTIDSGPVVRDHPLPEFDPVDRTEVFQAVLAEAVAAVDGVRPGEGADLSGVQGLMDRIQGDFGKYFPKEEFEARPVGRVEEIAPELGDALERAGWSRNLLHPNVVDAMGRGRKQLKLQAQRALVKYQELPLAERLPFVTEGIPGSSARTVTIGDYAVVATAREGLGEGLYQVTHIPTGLRWGFSNSREETYHEVFLGSVARDAPAELEGIKVAFAGGTVDFADASQVAGRFTLATGTPEGVDAAFGVADGAGTTWFFTKEGVYNGRTVRLSDGTGSLHYEVGLPETTEPRFLDAAGRRDDTVSAVPLGSGRIALRRDVAGRQPLEHRVYHAYGALQETTVAIRQRAGVPTGEYWWIDHTTGTASRIDATSTPAAGPHGIATVGTSSTGALRLTSQDQPDVVLFEQEPLGGGHVLHVDRDEAGKLRWTEFDP